MIIFVILILIGLSYTTQENCMISQQFGFVFKNTLTKFPLIPDPYIDPSQQYLRHVNQIISNKNLVCAIKYKDSTKLTYQLKTFNSISQIQAGYIVTHQGQCGSCSTTKDLWVYLTTDLTRTVRKCGIVHFKSSKKLYDCIKQLGFTDACTQIWKWNTLNTKKYCQRKCIYALLTDQKFVKKGKLNPCLQCDEDISGPIFKYESGRTRRNSGIKSQIDRPEDQIYNMTHCYY